jgi:hypothetical protein
LSTAVVAVGDLPYYDGSYTVTPILEGFDMPTRNRAMAQNVTVKPIPISKVTNTSGGYTYTIG